MAREPAVFDAGPIIYLDALGYLDVLKEPYRVMIPDAVVRELQRRRGAPGGGVSALWWIERRSPTVGDVRLVASGPPAVDPGEREAIALARGTGATVVLDDRRGRRRARILGVPLTGTLGVLLGLHRAGRARRLFEEDLDALDAAGMYLTADLRRRVMDRLRGGEGPRER